MPDVLLYATDTMADWEYGYVAAGLAWAGDESPYRLRVVGDGAGSVTTKGLMRIETDGELDAVDEDDVAMLVLPGADSWGAGHEPALDLAGRLLERGVPVAAICGATFGLARAGVLDDREHTSNAADYLLSTGYAGGDRYREAPVVEHRDVITAPATKPVDFAAAIFRRLGVFPPAVVDAWYGLCTTGERHYFDELTGAGAA
ncbi:MAG TPA: DJ-1/PfpI family protein [Friedmanniella sp.]